MSDPIAERLKTAREGSIPEAFSAAFGSAAKPSPQARRVAASEAGSPPSDDADARLEDLALRLLRTEAALGQAEQQLMTRQGPPSTPSIQEQIDAALARGSK